MRDKFFCLVAGLLSLFPFSILAQNAVYHFIRFNTYVGYVIDSTENSHCNCVKFAGNKYRYGSLIQLDDSSVVFVMKVEGHTGFVTVPVTEEDSKQLSKSASFITTNFSSEEADRDLMRSIADSTYSIETMDYYELKFKKITATANGGSTSRSNYHGTIDKHIFSSVGVGIANRQTYTTFLSPGIRIGGVYRKHILTIGYLYIFQPRIIDIMDPREHIHEISLLYGRLFDAGKVYFTVNTGVSYASGILRGNFLYSNSSFLGPTYYRYEHDPFHTLSVPLVFEMIWGKRRPKGSVSVFAGINSLTIWYGVMIAYRMSTIGNAQ